MATAQLAAQTKVREVEWKRWAGVAGKANGYPCPWMTSIGKLGIVPGAVTAGRLVELVDFDGRRFRHRLGSSGVAFVAGCLWRRLGPSKEV